MASIFLITLKFDNYFLFLLITLGSLLVIIHDNLFIIYLGVEIQAFSTYIIISKNGKNGSEAGLKYYILGSISSGFFLLILSFITSNGCSMVITDIEDNLSLIVIILVVFFKLGLFPFYFWIPDIYEGSTWPIIGLLILPKISILSVLLKISSYFSNDLIVILLVITIIIGTIGAFNQSKIKRLLAYSGVTHMGFIVLPLFLLSVNISFVYLFIYLITLYSFISIINKKSLFLISSSNINTVKKISISFLLLSMAGIPPFYGFIVKIMVLVSCMTYNYYFVSLVIMLFSIISVSFYLRLINILHFKSAIINNWSNILIDKNHTHINDYFLGLFFFVIIGVRNFIFW